MKFVNFHVFLGKSSHIERIIRGMDKIATDSKRSRKSFTKIFQPIGSLLISQRKGKIYAILGHYGLINK